MANLTMLVVSMIALLGHALATNTGSKDQKKSSVIRNEAVEVTLSASGDMTEIARQEPNNADAGVAMCNHIYMHGKPNTNECIEGFTTINEPDYCERAATSLNLVAGDSNVNGYGFSVHNDQIPDATLPYPKNCFAMANGTVYWNPTANTPGKWEGTPICMTKKYPSGTDNPTPDMEGGGCPKDFKPILDPAVCKVAFSCADGQAGCILADFENGDGKNAPQFPKGCYRENRDNPQKGCFDFNRWELHNSQAVSGSVQGTSVCTLCNAQDKADGLCAK